MGRKYTHRAIPEGQEALPFRGSSRGGMIAFASVWERRAVAGLGACFLLFAGLYIYFVMASIVHVAALQELAGKTAQTKAAVSTLETSYLSKTQGITEAYARSVGFVSADTRVFVQRTNTVTLH